MMDLSFLPLKCLKAIEKVNVAYLYELRFRTGYPIKVNFNNKIQYLGYNGLSLFQNQAIICEKTFISEIINNVTEHSLYAFNDRIKEGYLTNKCGVRIGLAGQCVFCDSKIQTIKNFTSLNIRIPHQIADCSLCLINEIIDKNAKINSTLIVSPPFLGKTTLLKDIALKLNQQIIGSILIIDERGEFAEIDGENIDKISYSSKNYAFTNGLRSLSPSIVITDELINKEDWECVNDAINSGVKIIASCHSDCLMNLVRKDFFIKNLFDRYIVLSNKQFGQVDKIYDKDFNVR